MTSGVSDVTNRVPPWGYALASAGALAACLLNVWTATHDVPAIRAEGRLWEVITWELTSAAMTIVLLPLVGRVVRRAGSARSRGLLRFVGIHLAGLGVFACLHIGGFVLLRVLVYAIAGGTYDFGGLSEWLYELPKDAGTYLILATILGASLAWTSRPPGTQAEDAVPSAANPIVIRDGERTYRVPPGEIVAVNAAGNYAEFRLADGRRPLMRATLSSLEGRLAAAGFARTHRSWLINPDRVREISPTGGGDYRLLLDPGVEVPLSRRYTSVLQELRVTAGLQLQAASGGPL